MKKVDWGWQGKAQKLQDRGNHLLKNLPIPADIVFEFEEDQNGVANTVAAHKMFMAIGSEVFHAMFYGPAADASLARVPIPNYSKEVFETLVSFFYTDEIPDIASSLAGALEVLKCALQYGVPQLAMACRCEILKKLRNWDWSTKDLWNLLSEARLLEENEIEEGTLRMMDGQSLDLFDSLHKSRATTELMEEILQRSELMVPERNEINLYNGLKRWAIEKSSEVGQNDAENFQELLKPLLKHIRFLRMSPAQLAQGPVKDRVFTGDEVSYLFEKKFSPVANVPRDGQAAQAQPLAELFSSSPRFSRTREEIGQVDIMVYWSGPGSGMGCADRPEPAPSKVLMLRIEPDKVACPETSRRFLDLCRGCYPFSVLWNSTSLGFPYQYNRQLGETYSTFYAALPSTENQLSHDSGGTVALRLKEASHHGSCFQLVISSTEEGDITEGAVVFGRLRQWNGDFDALQGIADIPKKIPLLSGRLDWHIKSSVVEQALYG